MLSMAGVATTDHYYYYHYYLIFDFLIFKLVETDVTVVPTVEHNTVKIYNQLGQYGNFSPTVALVTENSSIDIVSEIHLYQRKYVFICLLIFDILPSSMSCMFPSQ